METTPECSMPFWLNSESSKPQKRSCTATYIPSLKPIKTKKTSYALLIKAETNLYMTFISRLLNMGTPVLDDNEKTVIHLYCANSGCHLGDCQEVWLKGMDIKRESNEIWGISKTWWWWWWWLSLMLLIIFTNPSARAGYVTRSIF